MVPGREMGAGGGGCVRATWGSALSDVTSTSWSALRSDTGGGGGLVRSVDGGGVGGNVEALAGAGGNVGVLAGAGGNVEALTGAGSSIVANATRDRIRQRRSTDAFARYSMTSSSMMIGRATFEMGNAGGFGRIGTTVALEAGGARVAGWGVKGCGAAMVLGTKHASFPADLHRIRWSAQ